MSVGEQQRAAGLLFNNEYAASRADGLLELSVVRQSKNDGDVVGGRIIARAVHEWADDYGDDVINALVLGTVEGASVKADLASKGNPLLGLPENIVDSGFDPGLTIDTDKMANILENLTAIRTARAGWGPTQVPSSALASSPNGSSDPDLYFNLTARVADVLSTKSFSSSVRAALVGVANKVSRGQTQHVVLNLDRSPWDIEEVVQYFNSGAIEFQGVTYSSFRDAVNSGAPGTFFDDANGVRFPLLRVDLLKGNDLVELYQ